MAAHDLRQPLQVILSAFAWLERHRPMGREQQYVELGELAARRLREQLDHLADVVRLHNRKRGALFRPSSLHRSSTPYIRRMPTWRERGA
jgi:signal transduction histidine kinase